MLRRRRSSWECLAGLLIVCYVGLGRWDWALFFFFGGQRIVGYALRDRGREEEDHRDEEEAVFG